jgi:hypothetical protein
MKMRTLNYESVDNAVDAAGVDGAHASIVAPKSHEPDVVSNEIDDRKTPPVFGRLWRECISVFTLAFAPGLNVLSLQSDLTVGNECGQCEYCVAFDW